MALDFGAMGDLVQKAQEMQRKVADLQADLAGRTVSADAGGGMVTATANGAGELVSIRLEREIINPGEAEMLEDLILAAANEALKKAQDLVAREMAALTGGLKLPGLFGQG
ncbi:MAG: YbaB/EbfC family nucleoid-associated protein [Candidatus Adiutrix sp.]|jgi:DNA-binding YbaB/EbfC family protein|nr:YbaB/EbfC family nucleoid-associated protein [Candidatus Adiutrix sp.]